jgi:hypothetical protein
VFLIIISGKLYHTSFCIPIIDFDLKPEANCLSAKGCGKKLILVINIYLDFAFYTDFEWESYRMQTWGKGRAYP